MANERIEVVSKDTHYMQEVQSGRTNFSPGKATASAGEQNWPTEFKVPTGNPAIDSVGMTHTRVLKTGRASICDQEIPAPQVTGVYNRSQTGTAFSGSYTFTDTDTKSNLAKPEKLTGSTN